MRTNKCGRRGSNQAKGNMNAYLYRYGPYVVVVFVLMLCYGLWGNRDADETNNVDDICLTVVSEGYEDRVYTLTDLQSIDDGAYEGIYSTVNDWPTEKEIAAKGVKVEMLLKEAGLYNAAQVITFRSADGYQVSLTREQLIDTPRYYFKKEVDGNSIYQTESILSWNYKEGTGDVSETETGSLSFFMGQAYEDEHTNPTFIIGVSEVDVSSALPEKWEKATVFPAEGIIARGETVKLQHPDMGHVKLYYTTNGTEPTVESALYNPSTYQTELNVPIVIDGDTLIKVLAVGYGRTDSDIAVYEFYIE